MESNLLLFSSCFRALPAKGGSSPLLVSTSKLEMLLSIL